MIKIIFLVLSFVSIYAQDAFISAHKLKNLFDNKKLVVIDVSDSYKKSHISGAVSFNVNYLINKEASYNALKSHKRLLEIFSEFGLADDSKIVIYGRANFRDLKYSSFLAFVLLSSGFKDISILDGGYMSMVFEDSDLITKDERELEETSLNLDAKDMLVDAKYILEHKDEINLIDARPRFQYDIGHIDGASSCSYNLKFKRDYTIRSSEDIKYTCLAYLKDSNDMVVIYADDIFTSTLEWYVVSTQLDFKDVKIYYNSFAEYNDLELYKQ